METKELLKLMCEMLFKETSMVVCNDKESEKYRSLVKSTTLRKFLYKNSREKPTDFICNIILEKCRYYLYYDKYKTCEKTDKMQVIRIFGKKVLALLVVICKRNYAFLDIWDDEYNVLNEEKRDLLYAVLKAVLFEIANKSKYDVEIIKQRIDEICIEYRNDLRIGKIVFTRDNIERLQAITACSENFLIYVARDGGVSLNDYLEYRKNNFIKCMDFYIEFFENVIKHDEFDSIPKEIRQEYTNLTVNSKLINFVGPEENWRARMFNDIDHNSIKEDEKSIYKEFIKDLLASENPEQLKRKTVKFYRTNITADKKSEVLYYWKHDVLYNIIGTINFTPFMYDYINYIRNKRSFFEGIMCINEYRKKVIELVKRCRSNNLEKYKNQWLICNESYQGIQIMLDTMIDYFLLQTRIYEEFSIDTEKSK